MALRRGSTHTKLPENDPAIATTGILLNHALRRYLETQAPFDPIMAALLARLDCGDCGLAGCIIAESPDEIQITLSYRRRNGEGANQ
jgi:hypothetical protein